MTTPAALKHSALMDAAVLVLPDNHAVKEGREAMITTMVECAMKAYPHLPEDAIRGEVVKVFNKHHRKSAAKGADIKRAKAEALHSLDRQMAAGKMFSKATEKINRRAPKR